MARTQERRGRDVDWVADVVADTRLSADARIMVLHVGLKGPGEHEVSREEWSMVLNQAAKDRVQQARRIAEFSGWLESRPGGRGHSDCFAVSRCGIQHLKDRHRGIQHLSDEYVTESAAPKRARGGDKGGVDGGWMDGERVDDGARAENDGISDKATKALEDHDTLLTGCRGSLRDYLARRVKPARQYAYVQTLAGWLQGTDRSVFQKPDGTGLDPPDRTRILGGAFNELAAIDEGKMKWPAGDVRNLRTKISILVGNEHGDKPWRNGRAKQRGTDSTGTQGAGGSETPAKGGYDQYAVHSD